MSKSYQAAIDIIQSGSFDSREVCIKLAKMQPALFVRLVRGEPAPDVAPQWVIDVRDYLQAGQIVDAVKALRNGGMYLGLKEAKEVIDAIRTDADGLSLDPVARDLLRTYRKYNV